MRKTHALLTVAALTAVGAIVPADPASAASSLQITKVSVNAPGKDTSSNASVNGEYVIIKNVSSSSKKLTGYTLRDTSKHVYTFGSFTLQAGKSVKVYTGKGTNTASKRFWGQTWHVWNNASKDSATLKKKSGTKVAACSWKSVSEDERFAGC